MEVHSTGVQWPAPLQGPHLLIRGSPLPGKYAWSWTNIFTRSHAQTSHGRHCGFGFSFFILFLFFVDRENKQYWETASKSEREAPL